jgi:2-keto-3-deoxy-L-arabinonate dehydratase
VREGERHHADRRKLRPLRERQRFGSGGVVSAAPHEGFAGIYPILYAFFGSDGQLDREAMRRQVAACLASGAHGLAILGLATEVGKLSPDERRLVLAWAAEDVAGRVPLAVTVAEAIPEAQSAFVREAASAGAAWAILQPPPERGLAEIEYLRFFGRVADASPLPLAIQNAPDYLGVGLSPAGLRELNRQHPNVSLLKHEGPAVGIRQVVEETEGAFRVFPGRGGLEMTDLLRAGCAGLIPAPDCADVQVRIFELMRRGGPGNEAEAEGLYRETLPGVVFVMQSIDHLLCYGKRLVARRLGLGPVRDRPPGLAPTPFGVACMERYADRLGRLPG